MIRASILAAALLALSGSGLSAADARRPNVLFISADDLNTKLGCYGAQHVKTPNLDRLAAMGVRFDRAFCQYPVCNASRSSVLSGLYPETTRVFANNQDPRATLKTAVLLPEMFKANGYFIGGAGKVAHGRFANAVKWEAFDNPAGGDDDDEGGAPAPAAAKKAQEKRAAKKAARVAKAATKAQGKLPFAWGATANKDAQEPDGQIARQVVRLLEQHKDGPFFIAAGFHKPHVAHIAPRAYFDMYPTAEMPLAPREGDPIPTLAANKLYPNLTDDQQRQIIAHYSAVTTFMDAQVGVLLEAMDRLKLWDNTLVVFWSDHGWHHGEHGGAWAKFTLMSESARVPLIVAGPGIKPAVASGLVELVDLYPTLAELSGLTPPANLQGRSFAPLLKDPTRPGKDTVYTVVRRGRGLARAVRTADETYIEYPDGAAQLFAASDVREADNLAGESNHADDQTKMKQLLRQTSERATR